MATPDGRQPASPPLPKTPSPEGVLRVLRYLYLDGTDSGRQRTALPERAFRGSRSALLAAKTLGLVTDRRRARDGKVFWVLTPEGMRSLGVAPRA